MLIIFLKFRENRLTGYETRAILRKVVRTRFPRSLFFSHLEEKLKIGKIHAEEASGSPGERWQWHQVLAHGHIPPPSFFQIYNRNKTDKITWSIPIAGTACVSPVKQAGYSLIRGDISTVPSLLGIEFSPI